MLSKTGGGTTFQRRDSLNEVLVVDVNRCNSRNGGLHSVSDATEGQVECSKGRREMHSHLCITVQA